MVTKKEMLALLEATEFPKNKGRTNILNKGQTYSQSMVLGKVRKLYSSCDGKVCKEISLIIIVRMSKSISKMNKKELYELCKTLQEDLHKEKLFNDEIVELKQENEELKNENFKLRRRITVVSRNLKEEKDSLDEILCGPTDD